MTSRRLEILAALAAALALSGCGWGSKPSAPRPNLLLITMDTTRADHLGAYGDAAAATPNLDRLAREGVACDRAIAVAPLTLPSHVSMLTGLYPPRHGVRDNADFRLPESETTLAEHLKAQGYATGAVVGAYVLSGSLGLAQGFDKYDEPKPPKISRPMGAEVRFAPILERKAKDVTDAALAVLEGLGSGPFFLWVHYYDPHAEYHPPEPFATTFKDRLYDGEIAYMDQEIGRLLDALRSRGLLDRTLVAAVADHGESLGEHGEDTHGLFVYDATVRVPLILRFPGAIPAGPRYPGLVSAVDLAPTLLDLIGAPPMRGVHGKSAAAGLRGGQAAPRDPVYSEAIYPDRLYGWAPLFALRSADRKFIEAPEAELYDLDRDPGERENLAAAWASETTDWRRRLQAAFQDFGKPDPGAESAMNAEQKAALESLGYLQNPGGAAPRATKPDPKRLARVHNLILKARPMLSQGKPKEVEALLQLALRGDPENPAAKALLGTLRFSTGSRESGLADLEAAAKAAPNVYETQWNLGNALHLAGRYAEAADAFRAAIGLQPGSAQAHFALGNALAAMKNPPAAVEEYRKAMSLGLNTAPVAAALGSSLADAGNLPEAEKALRAAVSRDAAIPDAWNKLGIVLEKTGRRPDAVEAYGHAIQLDDGHADARFNRGKLRLLSGDKAGAREDVDALLAKHPDYAPGLFLKANVLLAEGDETGAKAALRTLAAKPGVDPKIAASARGMLKQLGG